MDAQGIGRPEITPKPITHNTLFYGDNLPILRNHSAGESVDLVYLDQCQVL